MKQYYYKEGDTQQGPLTLKELKGRSIKADTPVWYDPLPKWTTADQVPELRELYDPTVVPSDREYYYKENGVQNGPFPLGKLKGKNITAATPVWYHPLPQWTTAGELQEFKAIIDAVAGAGDRQYYYKKGDAQQGPFNLKDLRGKNITAATPVWYDPLPKWTTAGELQELKEIIVESSPVAGVSNTVAPEVVPVGARDYYYKEGATQFGPFSLAKMQGKPLKTDTPVWYHPLPKWTTAGELEELKLIIEAASRPAERDYYYKDGGTQYGPHKFSELKGKSITAETPVWYHPLPQWTTAGQLEELKDILVAARPVSETKQVEATATAAVAEREYYYKDGASQYGPHKLTELKGKNISAETPVWYHPLPQWTTAGQMEELKDILVAAKPMTETKPVEAPAPVAEREYYYKEGATQFGPHKEAELKGKNITSETPVWYHPLPQWTTAGQVQELKDILVAAKPVTETKPVEAPAPVTERDYYYKEGSTQYGPFTLNKLEGKNITAATPVWYHPLPKWTTAGEVPELSGILVSRATTSVAETPAVTNTFTERQYYIKEGATQLGPFLLKDLKARNITPATPLWYHPLPKWTTASQVHEVMELINTPIPVSERQYYFREGQLQYGPYQLKELRGKKVTAITPMWYHPLPKWTTAGQLREVMDFLNAPVPLAEREYYYKDGLGQYGPYSLQELSGRNINANTPVWYHPLPNWTTAGYLEELTSLIGGNKQAVETKKEESKFAQTPDNISEVGDRQYFYKEGEMQFGPLPLSALKEKKLNASTPVWYHPLSQWTTAGEVKELKNVIVTSNGEPLEGATESKIITPSGITINEEVKSTVVTQEPKAENKPIIQSQTVSPSPTGIAGNSPMAGAPGYSGGVGQKPAKNKGNGNTWFMWIVILAVAGGGGYFGYAYFIKDKKNDKTATETGLNRDSSGVGETAQGSLPASSTELTLSDTSASFSGESSQGTTKAVTTVNDQKTNKTKTKTVTKPDPKAAVVEEQLREEEERRRAAQALAKEASSKEAQIRNNWTSYVTFGKLDYKASGLGGIKEFDVRVFNATDYVMDEVKIRLDYIKSGGGVFKSETITLKNLPARSGVFSKAPESKRGTKVNAYFTAVNSRQLHLCYPANNGNSGDPYYCN